MNTNWFQLYVYLSNATSSDRYPADVTLDNRELPAVEKPMRILGACGGDGFAACTLSANDATRHFTVGATGELELHNLVVTGGKAAGRPWADGGAAGV